MKFSSLLKMMRFWPPFLGSGIKVCHFNADYTEVVVQMKMRFWNKNYVGTHFGGSLYSMTDPFYMLMLLQNLGKNYIVWDKASTIKYILPAKGTVYATFNLSIDTIESIRNQLKNSDKVEPEFSVEIKDGDVQTVAFVTKILHVSKKRTI
ncbi:MAG: YiiD C-terminal domain-containing protein [Legionella sp.]|jgi:hypothetical protein